MNTLSVSYHISLCNFYMVSFLFGPHTIRRLDYSIPKWNIQPLDYSASGLQIRQYRVRLFFMTFVRRKCIQPPFADLGRTISLLTSHTTIPWSDFNRPNCLSDFNRPNCLPDFDTPNCLPHFYRPNCLSDFNRLTLYCN